MLHKNLDSVLGLERWGKMLCGYFGIVTMTLIIEVNTRSFYFKMRKKDEHQNGKLKLSSVVIRDLRWIMMHPILIWCF